MLDPIGLGFEPQIRVRCRSEYDPDLLDDPSALPSTPRLCSIQSCEPDAAHTLTGDLHPPPSGFENFLLFTVESSMKSQVHFRGGIHRLSLQ